MPKVYGNQICINIILQPRLLLFLANLFQSVLSGLIVLSVSYPLTCVEQLLNCDVGEQPIYAGVIDCVNKVTEKVKMLQ